MFTPGRIMEFFHESLQLQLVRDLTEFVDIDTRPEPEGVGNRLRRGMASSHDRLADAGGDYSLHDLISRYEALVLCSSTKASSRSFEISSSLSR
jgi:hypothetical protein